ncbi:MAG TPA: RNA polymerase sigma factor [Vicinamibacterales bacterium]|nr:RNA polymerase sigma factor [Vicinamibacterales bacterium]
MVIPDVLTAAVVEPVREDSANRVAALFDAHHERLYRLARRLTSSHEDARDVVQDTFVRAAQRIGGVPAGTSSGEAWLVRVLVNICRDRWRQRATRARLDATVLPPPASARSDEAALVARDTIWRALERLPMKRRAALVMFELEGAPIDQIASTLGMNPITVRWHLSRGRRELAQWIRESHTHA